jgi:hypothetical protein
MLEGAPQGQGVSPIIIGIRLGRPLAFAEGRWDPRLRYCERSDEGGQHLLFKDRIQGKRRLCLSVAERDSDVVPIANDLYRHIPFSGGAQAFLRASELKLVLLPQIVVDCILKALEYTRVQDMHSKEA